MKTSNFFGCSLLSLGLSLACAASSGGADAGDGLGTDGATNAGGTGSGVGGSGLATGGAGNDTGGTGTGSGTGSGGGTINPGAWNAFTMTGADATLASAYQTWKAAFYRDDCGGGVASVKKSSNETVSEGIGYGMLITANLGTQADFDGLNQFYQNASKTESGLMYWQCAGCGNCGGGASASDGDLDVAMALLQADQRWGGYSSAALAVIQNLRKAIIVETCGSLTIMKPGEWGGCSDAGSKFINPSYFSPGYYRAFAKADPSGAATWNALIDSTYTVLASSKDSHHNGNLMWPDGQSWNGTAFSGSTGFAGNGYDACRVPWRLAIDYAWTGEARAQTLLSWASGQIDASSMAAMSTDQNSAFFGALALTGTAVSQEKADAYYSTWTTANLDDAPYYQGTLKLIYLMQAAGQFPSTL